jgi:hypothetical protein
MKCIRALECILGRSEGDLVSTEEKYGPYCHYDFFSGDGKLWIEHKQRSFPSSQYATTVVGKVKVDYARRILFPRGGVRVFFIFGFTDGTYYIELDNSWDSFQLGEIRGKAHYFIPVDKLIKFE